MTIFTGGAFLAAFIYAGYARDQVTLMANAMGVQKDAAVAAQKAAETAKKQLEITDRPWVGVGLTIKQKIMFSDWNNQRGINVPLSFALKNYGASPARNVTIVSQIRPHPGNAHARELDDPQKKMCIQARKQAIEKPINGVTIFPADTVIEDSGVGISGGEIYKTTDKILFSVFGCIDYTFADGQHGHTAFRMLLGGQPERGQWSGLPFQLGNDSAYAKQWEDTHVHVGTAASYMFRSDPSGGNYTE